MLVCPKCGNEIQELILPSNPPQRQNRCFSCQWQGEQRKADISEYAPGSNPKIIAS